VATISQGCTGAGQRADTPVDKDPGEKRTPCIRRCFRECVCRSDIFKRDRTIRRVAIVFVDGQDESCTAQAEINPAFRIVWCTIGRAFASEGCRRTTHRQGRTYAWSNVRVVLVWIRAHPFK